MSFKNFNYESEINDVISRVGLLINSGLDYTRRRDLEGTNNHLIIIDIMSTKTTRIINIYRPFNPRSGIHPRQFFISQLNLIKYAMTSNTVLMGDFNLDWSKKTVANMLSGSILVTLKRPLEVQTSCRWLTLSPGLEL
jgi:hypothetical protein